MTTLNDAQRLKQLYDSRAPKGMSQEEFGKTFGIGTQSMVSQYLSGHRPLNYEAVAKFAKGLRCTIADISPELAMRLKAEILPVLGRVSLKAALLLALSGVPGLEPAKAAETFTITFNNVSFYTLRFIRRILRAIGSPARLQRSNP